MEGRMIKGFVPGWEGRGGEGEAKEEHSKERSEEELSEEIFKLSTSNWT